MDYFSKCNKNIFFYKKISLLLKIRDYKFPDSYVVGLSGITVQLSYQGIFAIPLLTPGHWGEG